MRITDLYGNALTEKPASKAAFGGNGKVIVCLDGAYYCVSMLT
jgi:hypothetical protein